MKEYFDKARRKYLAHQDHHPAGSGKGGKAAPLDQTESPDTPALDVQSPAVEPDEDDRKFPSPLVFLESPERARFPGFLPRVVSPVESGVRKRRSAEMESDVDGDYG